MKLDILEILLGYDGFLQLYHILALGLIFPACERTVLCFQGRKSLSVPHLEGGTIRGHLGLTERSRLYAQSEAETEIWGPNGEGTALTQIFELLLCHNFIIDFVPEPHLNFTMWALYKGSFSTREGETIL